MTIEPAEINPKAGYDPRAIKCPPPNAAAIKPIWNVISSQADVAVRDLLVATEDANDSHKDVPAPINERKIM